jgi:hypothetical protein
LEYLYIYNNNIKTTYMTELITSLPTRLVSDKGHLRPASTGPNERNEFLVVHKNAAEAKNWVVTIVNY